ncbi:MAG: helix-turn-helix domain-containing protein [Paracoccus sp. (in: a-proteobacteria)]|uniref:helix-turn-helix domain-containing protein n=1 Tax=Paracoccus sp. TaxID=267 RepID=UPI0039E295F5
MSNYRFAQLRLQVIELAAEQAGLSDKAFRLLIHLIVHRLNWADGTCHVDDNTLASSLGCSADTVSRAVACIEQSGLLSVKRGRWSRPTHYSMSAQAWQAAQARRRAPGKSAEQDTPQICGDYSANLPGNTPQKRGAFYRNEIKEKKARANATPATMPSFPDERPSGKAQGAALGEPAFVALKSFPMKMWNERLEDFGLPHIERWMTPNVTGGKAGFLLPNLWPARKDSPLWKEQLSRLGSQYQESQRKADDRHVL